MSLFNIHVDIHIYEFMKLQYKHENVNIMLQLHGIL